MTGTQPGMGAIPYDGGVTFRVWAPRARAVRVAGEFTMWEAGAVSLDDDGGGYWSTDVPGARIGQAYRFLLTGFSGDALWRTDPYAREMRNSNGDCVVYDPHKPGGGLTPEQLRAAKMILWRGHCSVHGRFSLDSVDEVRERVPGVTVLVHPECKHEVVEAADLVGSTEYIIRALDAAEPGSKWAIGTELNLVRRLAKAHPDKEVVFLDRTVCFCSTMNRIDLPHLVWTLESLVEGRVPNVITVDPETEKHAKAALDQMLALP